MPNVTHVALDCESFGADGITVHPRPDERHIRRSDVYELRPLLRTEFNIEGYPAEPFLELVLAVKPAQVTLVPDAPGILTSNCGWNVPENLDFLTQIVDRLKEKGIRTSIFIDTDERNILAAAKTGADRVEFYTGPYAEAFQKNPEAAVAPYVAASIAAHNAGLGVNAGHDLNLDNLAYFHGKMPYLNEVSIGHALISDALYFGLEETIKRYKACLK